MSFEEADKVIVYTTRFMKTIQTIKQFSYLYTACECKSDGATTCDPVTGHCHCLPGVTGPRCDRCLDRWVLIPEQGCQGKENNMSAKVLRSYS